MVSESILNFIRNMNIVLQKCVRKLEDDRKRERDCESKMRELLNLKYGDDGCSDNPEDVRIYNARLHKLEEESVQIHQAMASFEKELKEKVLAEYRRICREVGFDPSCDSADVVSNGVLPHAVTYGKVRYLHGSKILSNAMGCDYLELPLSADMSKVESSLVLDCKSRCLAGFEVEGFLTGMFIRYLTSFPVGSIRFAFCGAELSSMRNLMSCHDVLRKCGVLIEDDVCASNSRISGLLEKCNLGIGRARMKANANGCGNIVELYDKGIDSECFQLVVFYKVLRDASEDVISRILSCIRNYRDGFKCIWIDDFDLNSYKDKSDAFRSYVERLKSEMRFADELKYDLAGIGNGSFDEVSIVRSNASSADLVAIVSKCIESEASDGKSKKLPYEDVGFAKLSSSDDGDDIESISIPVGISDPDLWNMRFSCNPNDSSPIANMILGKSGSGKSCLIDSLILNGAMKYSPDELNFHLMDFKDGSSSLFYASQSHMLPHIRIISANNTPDEAHIIFSTIRKEGTRRTGLFNGVTDKYHVKVDNIAAYNKVAADKHLSKMPRIIIVIDECQDIFKDDDLADECADLMRKTRAWGMHFVFATQKIDSSIRKATDHIDCYYLFSVNDDTAEEVLGHEYSKRIEEIAVRDKDSIRKVLVTNGHRDPDKISVAYHGGEANQAKYVERIRERWSDYSGRRTEIIGDYSPLFVEDDSIRGRYNICDGKRAEGCLSIGENFNNHEDVTVDIKGMNHFMILSSNGVVSANVLACIADYALTEGIRIVAVDGSHDDLFSRMVSGRCEVYDPQTYALALKKVCDEYSNRKTQPRGVEFEPLVFVVRNLNSIDDFKNNRRIELKSDADALNTEISEDLSMEDLIRAMELNDGAAGSVETGSVSGKDDFLSLISSANEYNIFVCFSLSKVDERDCEGDEVFNYRTKSMLRNCYYKLLAGDMKNNDHALDFFEDAVSNRRSHKKLDQNTAIISIGSDDLVKFRFFQREL